MKLSTTSAIYHAAKERAEIRKKDSKNISAREISDVCQVSKQLFDSHFELGIEESETFRMLCRFASARMRPPIIRSHRRLIGPLIVASKKLAWRVLTALTSGQWESQAYFNRTVVRQLARSLQGRAQSRAES